MKLENDSRVLDFQRTQLPRVNKAALRMGVAGNYGLDSSDIEWAADHGANYWLWGTGFKKVTEGIREVIKYDRDNQIVALLGAAYFGWQIRRAVERALKRLNTDYLDVYKLGWLGVTSSYRPSTINALLKLKEEGKIRAIGTSIHNRQRAGLLAYQSEIDLFMIRYNAKHPGAEDDIFPHLEKRNPAIVSYTALAWTQLTRPLKGAVDLTQWPGKSEKAIPPLTPELCYRFALSNPHIHIVLTGAKNREQLEVNLNALNKGPLKDDEMKWIREYGGILRAKKKMDYV